MDCRDYKVIPGELCASPSACVMTPRGAPFCIPYGMRIRVNELRAVVTLSEEAVKQCSRSPWYWDREETNQLTRMVASQLFAWISVSFEHGEASTII